MLRAKADIKFTVHEKNYTAIDDFRVAFSFGAGMIFSATIKSDEKEYLYGEEYCVDLEFFTVEDEAYEALKPVLQPNMNLAICAGRKIIGIAKLLEYEYEPPA